ncbi:MAG: hypothetical protein LBR19_05245 [Bifidobacteriaceae bacterium]|jgi:hypothetical protein|nr:hypothetical protein [Bifidobacteriaceae bacterium]
MEKSDALIEATVQDMVVFQMEQAGMELPQALSTVFESVTFDKLSDPETGLYLAGSAYVIELLRDELRLGQFVQLEA